MLLAVAGLDEKAVAKRTQQLATGNWSAFPVADQVAFAFAHKQAQEPWSMTDADYQALVNHFGKHRAVDVVWWACRCHYMTRVADAFHSLHRLGPPDDPAADHFSNAQIVQDGRPSPAVGDCRAGRRRELQEEPLIRLVQVVGPHVDGYRLLGRTASVVEIAA